MIIELNLKKSNYILLNLRSNFISSFDLAICPHFLDCKNKIVNCNFEHIHRVNHILNI